MAIEISFKGIRITNVPEKETLNNETRYYVYEWFIKETNQVFYVGKGTGKRYKEEKNGLFSIVRNAFETDVRFVKENLNEYEALTLEEEIIQNRTKEGHILTNIITPGVAGALALSEPYEYFKTPSIWVTKVHKYYFNVPDYQFDDINFNNLLYTHFYTQSEGGLQELYCRDTNASLKKLETTLKKFKLEISNYIESNGGKVYKSKAKNAKSLIFIDTIDHISYLRHKDNGYDIYHLIDVLNFIRNK